MSAARRRSPSLAWIWLARLGRTLRWFVPGSPRVLVALVLIAATLGGTWYAWRQTAPLITEGNHYLLDPRAITITPPPAWIRADIRAEVVRDASLDDAVSILDPALARRVADAFEFHPWIDRVVQVTKLAGPRVDVEIVYRQPVAMVDVPSAADLAPIDVHGVRLPVIDFTPKEREHYPRISGIATLPLVGQTWDDAAAIGAASLAAALRDVWHEWQLAVIQPTAPTRAIGQPAQGDDITAATDRYPLYELLTRDDTRIIWGYAPQAPIGREPTVAEKLARLTEYAQTHGSLTSGSSTQPLDVRRLPSSHRTARGTQDQRDDTPKRN